MVLAVINFLMAVLIGYGAMEELIVRGIRGGEMQPLLIGVSGIAVSILLITSGIAMLRKTHSARRLVVITAILCILFHVYAALPPHRNVGIPGLIIGAGYGLALLLTTLGSRGGKSEVVLGVL